MKKYVSKSVNQTVKASRSIKASTDMSKDEMWDVLMEMGVSEQTLQVVTDINGYSEQSFCMLFPAIVTSVSLMTDWEAVYETLY